MPEDLAQYQFEGLHEDLTGQGEVRSHLGCNGATLTAETGQRQQTELL